MITQHPEVERKVLAELDGLGLLVTIERPKPRPLEYDDLTKLTYTNNCIKVRSAHYHCWVVVSAGPADEVYLTMSLTPQACYNG